MSLVEMPADPVTLHGTAKARIPSIGESMILIGFGDGPDPDTTRNLVLSLADARQLRVLLDRALADPAPRPSQEDDRAPL